MNFSFFLFAFNLPEHHWRSNARDIEIVKIDVYLTAERAEAEGIEEAALTDLAGVGDSLPWPRLRPLVQEDDLRAVYNVRLYSTDVQHFLYLRDPYHVMV